MGQLPTPQKQMVYETTNAKIINKYLKKLVLSKKLVSLLKKLLLWIY